MASRFYASLTPEERAEWRRLPVTQAAFAMLSDAIADATGELCTAAAVNLEYVVRVKVGVRQGLIEALEFLESEK